MVVSARAAQGVILGQQGQAIIAKAVKPGISKMEDMRLPPAQNQNRKGASHVLQGRISASDRMSPAVHRLEAARARLSHALRRRLAEIAIDEIAHRELRSNSAAFGAADAIGDCSDDAKTRPLVRRPCVKSRVILIALAASLLRAKANAHIEAIG